MNKRKRNLSVSEQRKIRIRKARVAKQIVKYMFLTPASKWAD